MIFKGRNQIPYAYGCYGYTRGGGATWHGGQDIVGLDDVRVRALRGGKVIRSRIVTDHSNLTWEWGNYVTIRTECGEQDIYAHLDSRAVVAGQTVKAGDVIGIMGSTGNAAGGYKHTHYERRKPDGKTAIDPSSVSGCANKAGVYGAGEQTAGAQYTATPLVSGLRLRPYPAADDSNCNYAICYLEKGKSYPLVQTRNGWAFVLTEGTSGGWACISDDAGTYLSIEEV